MPRRHDGCGDVRDRVATPAGGTEILKLGIKISDFIEGL
jgi:hypothetical protein